MTGTARWVCVVAILSSSCGSSSNKPCAREVRTVVAREAMRVHGLSENDDAAETMNRLQSAVRCATEDDTRTLQAHAFLFRSRLQARGAVDEEVALDGRLKDVGVTVPPVDETRRGADSAQQQLADYAAAMLKAAGADADARLRAQLAVMALDEDAKEGFPHVTRALVNHVGPNESCFTVVNHQELPTGTAVVSLMRGANPLPLHGESPAFGVSKGKPRVVRLCISQPLKSDDVVQINVGAQKVWEQKLVITADDEIRGMLRRTVAAKDIKEACANAQEYSARTACDVMVARRTP